MAYQILKRLGYSEEDITRVCFFIANHDKTIQVENINEGDLEMMKKLLYIQYCDASGYNPEYTQRVYDRLNIYLKVYEKRNVNKVDNPR